MRHSSAVWQGGRTRVAAQILNFKLQPAVQGITAVIRVVCVPVGKLRNGGLIDCLQLSDKAQILMEKPEVLEFFGFESRKTAKRIVKEFESLRNNLAHAQDIVTHDWAAIARIASRLEEAVLLRRSHPGAA